MDGVLNTAELEGQVEILVARDRPDLRTLNVLGALDPSVDRICHVARDLREREARVEDDDELPEREGRPGDKWRKFLKEEAVPQVMTVMFPRTG